MKFSEHQSRLLCDMLKLIEDFQKGNIQYFKLVYGLEGILDAGEFEDKNFINQWYDLWVPLEEFAAVEGNHTTRKDVDKFLIKMVSLLKNVRDC